MPTVLTEPVESGQRGQPRLARMARAFAVLFLEVEAGQRSRQQLQRLMCPVLFARLDQVWVRPDAAPGRVLAVHGVAVTPGRYEAVAVVERGARVGALALTLRRGTWGWRVDAIARPEDGPLPEPAYPVPRDEPDIFELIAM